MYAAYQDLRTVVSTRTNGRLFLDDAEKRDGHCTKYVTVMFEGTMEVLNGSPAHTMWEDGGPLFVLPWDIGEMPSEGESVLGTIKLSGHPTLPSTGIIRQHNEGEAFPAMLEASVHQVFDIPGYGKLHNKYPVMVSGVVDDIPPFHVEAACRSAMLFDEQDKPRGVIGGRSLTILGPA